MSNLARESMRSPCLLLGTALLAFLISPSSVGAGESYFLLLFASQSQPNDPRKSHSYASFVQLSWPGDGPCPPSPCIKAYTISWLPRTLPIRPYALAPEPGKNYGLHETIEYGLQSGACVSMWGPFQINGDLYQRAAHQAFLLGSGRVEYKLLDTGYRSDCVSNCIHAVSAIVEGPRVHVTSPGWGEVASADLLCQLSPWIVDRGKVYPYVSKALGLDRYPIVYQSWSCPPRGLFGGRVRQFLVGDRAGPPSFGPPLR